MTSAPLPQIASQVRRDIVRMVHGVSSGHPGGSLGCVEILTLLFFEEMQLNPDAFDMDGIGEDLFFLSNGHISPVWYSILSRRGYFPVSELATFRKINSRLQGHPATEEGLPGIRMASGSLGQGLSAAIGAAQVKKLNDESTTVFSLHGDGELQEGQIWEAAMYAAHHKVDNLISFVDCNGQQIDGPTDKVMGLGDLAQKWSAFGWQVHLCDGHDFAALREAIAAAKKTRGNGKPNVVLMKTEMGKGVDFMEGTHEWHGIAPNDDQLASALGQLEETLGDY
ncbi:MAG: transketolase [Crocinitomicaceae bacterium]|jgi:transketolase|nr:transketolase [Crocinitomicaceae bacterium]